MCQAASLAAGAHLAQSESVHFTRRLPIPPLIDAAKQGNAVKLKVTSGRHAFVTGKPTRSYGYSGPVLAPTVRLRRGDEVEMTVENALDVTRLCTGTGFWYPEMSMAGRIKSSSQAIHGARGSRLRNQPQPRGFILICTMTRPDRFIWGSRD